MIRTKVRAVLLAATVIAAPVALQAQAPAAAAPAAPSAPPEEASAWLAEIQQLHAQLTALQEKALQDPVLAAQRDSVGAHVQSAMFAIDPSLEQSMERMQAMQAEAAEAQSTGDQAKLATLTGEARQIEQKFLAAQGQALEKPELQAEIEAFQTALEKKIIASDPEAPKLLARFQELEKKLSAAAH